MKPKISLLTGSGFSIPEKLPSVDCLNKRLSKINEDEILIHTDQTALFLNGQNDPNRWSRWDERLFLQEFLEFYNSKILSSNESFHYETFYDFYSGYLVNEENKETIDKFCKIFNEKHFKNEEPLRDYHNMVSDFNRSYNQLLAELLYKSKYFEDVSVLNYPPYDAIINFIVELLKNYEIKFHTLNHDLFFDWLGHHHADLWQYFSDGYQLEGSPYYGILSYTFNQNLKKTYYVKLERFVNKFNKPLSFFKLHGSVFNTIVYSPKNEIIRLKGNYAISQFYMEMVDEQTGEPKFINLWDEAAPDFLSGTTNKMRYYSNDPYYKTLFEHFEQNLKNSEFLFVIGYGFKDTGINDYIEKFILSRNKPMIVITPERPLSELFEKYKGLIFFIEKSITQVTFDELVNSMKAQDER